PYGSLANCWFQPLTQTSNTFFVEAFSLKRGAKINGVFDLCKHLKLFFIPFSHPRIYLSDNLHPICLFKISFLFPVFYQKE
ncbi:hypothetical protein, partial [Phocaeicola coprophilus]|uniref:hypothetical protein n=1 Tax=Phocaeicola coprophilus TaxID=387090 RepID=UPI00266C6700